LNESIRYSAGKIDKSAPVFRPNPPTIILRLDDIQAKTGANIAMNMTAQALGRNMSIVLGVIPIRLETDASIVAFLSGLRNDTRVEIALHGLKHTSGEFGNLSEAQAYELISAGKETLSKQIGIIPVTFIPPNNILSNGTLTALEDSGFERFSSDEDSLDLIDGKLLSTGFNIRPPQDLTLEEQVDYNMDFAVNRCMMKLRQDNLCVVMLHPQDFGTQWKVNSSLISQYSFLLDRLQSLNATFSTFAQLQS
jgi:hypothetical protein